MPRRQPSTDAKAITKSPSLTGVTGGGSGPDPLNGSTRTTRWGLVTGGIAGGWLSLALTTGPQSADG
jgi:hypothetical protein